MVYRESVADGLKLVEQWFPGITKLVTRTQEAYKETTDNINFTEYSLELRESMGEKYVLVTYNESGVLADSSVEGYGVYCTPPRGTFATKHCFRLKDLTHVATQRFFHEPITRRPQWCDPSASFIHVWYF